MFGERYPKNSRRSSKKSVLEDLEKMMPLEVRKWINWTKRKMTKDRGEKNHGESVVKTRHKLNADDRDPEMMREKMAKRSTL